MSPHEIADEIVDHFENYGLSVAGSYAPDPDQVVSVLEFITDLLDFGVLQPQQIPDVLDEVKNKYKELGALGNQVTNYSDMGDESRIIAKY